MSGTDAGRGPTAPGATAGRTAPGGQETPGATAGPTAPGGQPVVAYDGDGRAVPPLLTGLLPAGVAATELHVGRGVHDLRRFGQLDADDRAVVDRAVASRRAEYGDVRWCARDALTRLFPGAAGPVRRGERGMPVFPEGSVGTLSHTDGVRVAVVGDARRWRSLGCDVEVADPLPEEVTAMVTSEGERRMLAAVRRGPSGELAPGVAATVLFSAKESVYKAWFPLARRFLDFDGAGLRLDADGWWEARILDAPTPVPVVAGRWDVRGTVGGDVYVVTTAAVGRGPSSVGQ